MPTAKRTVKKTSKAATKKTAKTGTTEANVSKAAGKKTIKATTKVTKKASVSKTAPKKTAVKKSASEVKKAVKKTPAKEPLAKKSSTKPSKVAGTSKKAATKEVTKKAEHQVSIAPKEQLKTPASLPLIQKDAFDKEFLEEQRQLLIKERQNHLAQAEDLKLEAQLIAQEGEVHDIQFDEESGEGDPLSIERERDQFLSAQEMHIVAEIDDALKKIEKGTYGYCEICHKPIPRQRLRAMPFARLCVECKTGSLTRRI